MQWSIGVHYNAVISPNFKTVLLFFCGLPFQRYICFKAKIQFLSNSLTLLGGRGLMAGILQSILLDPLGPNLNTDAFLLFLNILIDFRPLKLLSKNDNLRGEFCQWSWSWRPPSLSFEEKLHFKTSWLFNIYLSATHLYFFIQMS